MKRYDLYNPQSHEGYLPVRVLSHNIVKWFENTTQEFIEELRFEVETNDLKPGIQYHIEEEPVSEVSYIDVGRTIHLYENYNQFLWSLSYAFFVSFLNGIFLRLEQVGFDMLFTGIDGLLLKGHAAFQAAMSLLKKYNNQIFFKLPNPEKFTDEDELYIGKVNGVYVAAMVFTLLHEYAHHYYGHVDKSSSEEIAKEEEYDADELALEKVSENFQTSRGQTYKVGVTVGVCSLIMIDSAVEGGKEHPDSDHRLINLLLKMKLGDHDIAWGVACTALAYWSHHYKMGTFPPKTVPC